jgi:hypothetical protein
MIEDFALNGIEPFDTCEDWLHPCWKTADFDQLCFYLVFTGRNNQFFIARFLIFCSSFGQAEFVFLFFGNVISCVMVVQVYLLFG